VSRAPVLAILDADDAFVAGRFDSLLRGDDWDFVADNIVFLDRLSEHSAAEIEQFEPCPHFLTTHDFITGNLAKPGVQRGELGFLKPAMRRSFLDRYGLRYDEGLRLGEDYELYVRALSKGARYKVVHSCGYCAVVRPDSLSGRHSTADIENLYQADLSFARDSGFPAEALPALRRHARQTKARYELRKFLDLKAQGGLAPAARYAVKNPLAIPSIAHGIARDKLETLRNFVSKPQMKQVERRYLLSPQQAARR
jgi:succinoglycan biosynthesis protein ExoU